MKGVIMNHFKAFYRHEVLDLKIVDVKIGNEKVRKTRANGLTHVIVTDLDNGKSYYSVAICGAGENISKTQGRAEAIKKVFEKKQRVLIPGFSLETSTIKESHAVLDAVIPNHVIIGSKLPNPFKKAKKPYVRPTAE